jgi:hypothetical protein
LTTTHHKRSALISKSKKERALSIFKRVLFACVCVVTSPVAQSESILVYGAKGELRGRLEASAKESLPEHTVFASDQTQKADLAIIVGATALEKFCSENDSTPITVTHIYERRFASASKGCTQPVGAFFFDAPFEAQAELAEALFPGQSSASLTSSVTHQKMARAQGIDHPLPVEGRSVYPAIKALLTDSASWSVFYVEMDPAIYQGTDYRLTIETLARNRKAAIVPVMSLVKAGAVAGVYYDKESLEDALFTSVSTYLSDGVSTTKRSKHLSVAINHSILRTLYGRKLTADDVETIENSINDE